jgi:hypothetical protein
MIEQCCRNQFLSNSNISSQYASERHFLSASRVQYVKLYRVHTNEWQ